MAGSLTAEGFAFEPGLDVWCLGSQRGPVRLDFASLPGIADPLRTGIKSAMLELLRVRSTSAVVGIFEKVRSLVRDASSSSGEALGELTLSHANAYVQRLPSHRVYIANELRNAFRAWTGTGAGGLGKDLVAGLDSIRGVPFVMGKATRTCSESEGALSDADVALLVEALLDAHRHGRMPLEDCCMGLVAATFGPRSSELAALKACDVLDGPDGGGTLMLPTAKQRGVWIRGWMRDRPLDPALWRLLSRLRDKAAGLGAANGIDDPLQAPLFQRRRALRGAAEGSFLEGLQGHMSSRIVSDTVPRIFDSLGVLGHLGEGNGRVTPVRLRRSYATSRFNAGASLAQIAWELGHSGGSQHAMVYVEPTPALARQIDAALAGRMDRFFGSFGLDGSDPALRPRFGGRSA